MNTKNYLECDYGSESYFYGSHLTSGCVPRFVVRLDAPVNEEVLCQTMEDILPRFPQMTVKVVRTADGCNCTFADNEAAFEVFHDQGDVVRTIGTADTHFYLFSVTWHDDVLLFDFHHLLGDGNGFIIFIKAVIYRYMELMGVPVRNDGSILTVNRPYLPEEGEDAYHLLEGCTPSIPDWYKPGLPVFNVPDISTADDPADTVVQITIPFKEFRHVFKAYHSSPVTFLSPLFSHAIYER